MFGKLAWVSATMSLLGAGYALADNNNVLVLQNGDNNVLSVDQTAASNSTVAAVVDFFDPSPSNLLNLVPAEQIGDGNEISVIVTNDTPSTVLFRQENLSDTLAGNSAIVSAGQGAVLVAMNQYGQNNEAALSVEGINSIGSINQVGMFNQAGLVVDGDFSFGQINQLGDNLTSSMTLGDGQNVIVNQIGNIPTDVVSDPNFVGVSDTLSGIQVDIYFPTFSFSN